MYHDQHQNKEDRIETLEPAIANGWLAFNERDLPPELWTQFRQFPSADHNDAPDAVQGACRYRVMTTAQRRFNLTDRLPTTQANRETEEIYPQFVMRNTYSQYYQLTALR